MRGSEGRDGEQGGGGGGREGGKVKGGKWGGRHRAGGVGHLLLGRDRLDLA